MVSQSYIQLLRQSNQGALLVYAHFAILTDIFKDQWYFQGWADRAVTGISNLLDSFWTEAIRWPQDQIRSELSAFLFPKHC